MDCAHCLFFCELGVLKELCNAIGIRTFITDFAGKKLKPDIKPNLVRNILTFLESGKVENTRYYDWVGDHRLADSFVTLWTFKASNNIKAKIGNPRNFRFAPAFQLADEIWRSHSKPVTFTEFGRLYSAYVQDCSHLQFNQWTGDVEDWKTVKAAKEAEATGLVKAKLDSLKQ